MYVLHPIQLWSTHDIQWNFDKLFKTITCVTVSSMIMITSYMEYSFEKSFYTISCITVLQKKTKTTLTYNFEQSFKTTTCSTVLQKIIMKFNMKYNLEFCFRVRPEILGFLLPFLRWRWPQSFSIESFLQTKTLSTVTAEFSGKIGFCFCYRFIV